MKKEKLVKILLTTVMMIALIAMSINVFAATSLDDSDVIDITNSINTTTGGSGSTGTGSSNLNTGISLNTGTTGNTYNTNINTNIANNANTNLPNTGIAENTMLIVAVIILGSIAIYAYTRIKYYKNI